jgi:hypothetical protein
MSNKGEHGSSSEKSALLPEIPNMLAHNFLVIFVISFVSMVLAAIAMDSSWYIGKIVTTTIVDFMPSTTTAPTVQEFSIHLGNVELVNSGRYWRDWSQLVLPQTHTVMIFVTICQAIVIICLCVIILLSFLAWFDTCRESMRTSFYFMWFYSKLPTKAALIAVIFGFISLLLPLAFMRTFETDDVVLQLWGPATSCETSKFKCESWWRYKTVDVLNSGNDGYRYYDEHHPDTAWFIALINLFVCIGLLTRMYARKFIFSFLLK